MPCLPVQPDPKEQRLATADVRCIYARMPAGARGVCALTGVLSRNRVQHVVKLNNFALVRLADNGQKFINIERLKLLNEDLLPLAPSQPTEESSSLHASMVELSPKIALRFRVGRFALLRHLKPIAWIMMRSATDLSKADLHVFSKLFDDGLERGQEAEAFSWCQIGGHDDVLDFFVGHLINIDMTRQPAP
jgi:hypothetical protein